MTGSSRSSAAREAAGGPRVRHPATGRPAARGALVPFALLFALAALWSVATPVFAVPDEPAHATYAAAAARGQLLPPTDGVFSTVRVPRWYVDAGAQIGCFRTRPRVSAGCARPVPADTTLVPGSTHVARFPPPYYLLAGLPSRVLDGPAGLYAGRLATAALVAALLAAAFAAAASWRRSPLLVPAVAVAVTPMLLFLAGSVNPQAVEIAAAVATWVPALLLLGAAGDFSDSELGRLVRTATAGAAVLLASRPLSSFWLACVLGVLLLAFGSSRRVRALLARRDVRRAVAGLLLLAVAAVVWTLLRDALAQLPDPRSAALNPLDAARLSLRKQGPLFVQMIGYFGWLDTAAPRLTYACWLLAVAGLAFLAVLVGARREVLGLAALAGLAVVVPTVLEVLTYRVSAFAWQGRYTLPLTVGVPLLAALAVCLRQDGLPLSVRRRLPRWLAGLVAVGHLVAFWGALNRYGFGVDEARPWRWDLAGWQPPLPAPLLIGLMAAVLLAYAGWLARLSIAPDRPDRVSA